MSGAAALAQRPERVRYEVAGLVGRLEAVPNEMRAIVELYRADHGSLARFYPLPYSQTTIEVMREFQQSWRKGLEEIPFDRLGIDKAFSGYVSYHQPLWKLYLGVWGKRNGSRFRRFLRERGAEVILHHEEPPLLTRTASVTREERARVRKLPEKRA